MGLPILHGRGALMDGIDLDDDDDWVELGEDDSLVGVTWIS